VAQTLELKGHEKQITTLSWTNKDDKWVMTAGQDATCKIWDPVTGKLITKFDKHKDLGNRVL